MHADLLDQAFIDHDRNEVLAGYDNVVSGGASLQFRQQGFVGIVGIHRNLDTGFLLELGDQFRRSVFRPVIDEQLAFSLGQPQGQHRSGCDEHG